MLKLLWSSATVNYTTRERALAIGVIAPEDGHEPENKDEHITT